MEKLDQWSGVALLIFSALICWGSALMPYGGAHNPGPGFTPMWIGIVLGGMSILLIVQSSLAKKKEKTIKELFAEDIRLGKVFIALVVLIIYGIALDYVGFILDTFLMIATLMRFIDPQPWKKVILWALGGSIVSYLIFEIWLALRLPSGFWGGLV